MNSLYFVAGASGSGKSAIIEDLKQLLNNDFIVYDFDAVGVPANADKKWRQQTTEQWLQKLVSEKKNAVLLGQMVLGEIIACPSANKLGKINFCLLDVSDTERINRLKRRATHGVDQHTLNWAAWLRMHHKDPQWQQHVPKDNSWNKMQFDRWDELDTWDSMAQVKIIDTAGLSIPEVAATVKQWIDSNG